MRKKVSILAVDLGATSGRVMRFSFDGDHLFEDDTFRFANYIYDIQGHAYWDALALYRNLTEGIAALLRSASGTNEVLSAGIDTWGCDFGLLDKNGTMLYNLMSYRDPVNKIYFDKVIEKMGAFGMYKRNGIANMPINGIYQLVRLYHEKPNLMRDVKTVLMLPDYFSWLLTGEIHNEYAAMTSAQLMRGTKVDTELLEDLGIDSALFGNPGAGYGKIGRCEAGIDILSVPGHDTAAAAIPAKTTEDRAFISSGTWMMLGAVLPSPCITEAAMEGGYSNYGGAENNIVMVRDITGLYLAAQCRNRWETEGTHYNPAELEKLALAAEPFLSFFDPDDESLAFNENMVLAITKLLGNRIFSPGELTRIIIESIAFKCAYALDEFSAIIGKRPQSIYIVGGGTRDALLVQSIADASGLPCILGPAESSVIGNAVTQLIVLGRLKDFNEARDLINRSFPTRTIYPKDADKWQEQRVIFNKIIKTA
jgi:sugar (pentulose or hexulose) kinase